MSEPLYLLCRVAGSLVGIPADAIEAVAPLKDTVSVPHAGAVVRGLAAIRSRLLTVIDTAMVAGVEPSADQQPSLMVITMVDGHGYGLLVSEVDDVVQLTNVRETPAHLSAGWRTIASGMADLFGQAVMVVEPGQIITAAQAMVHPSMPKAA